MDYQHTQSRPCAGTKSMLHCSVSDDGEHCSACLELLEVQSKIRECKELLDKLYIQEAHAKSSVNAVHDPIIRRLPLELVSDIFTLSNPSPVEHGPSLLGDTPVAIQRCQFSLGTVCAAWRNIVRSTPQLWTNSWIRLQIRGELPQMEFLLLSLRLSGSLLLPMIDQGVISQRAWRLICQPSLRRMNSRTGRATCRYENQVNTWCGWVGIQKPEVSL